MDNLCDTERVFHGKRGPIAKAEALDRQLSSYGRRLLVYAAGPYRDDRGEFWVEQNIRRAELAALSLWRLGYAVICPHKNTAHFGGAVDDSSGVGDDIWLEGDFEMVARCDLVVMLPGWEESQGAQLERRFAMHLCIPVFYWPECSNRLRQLLDSPAANGLRLTIQMRSGELDKASGRYGYEVAIGREICQASKVWPRIAERSRSSGEGGDASWGSEQEGPKTHSAPGGSDRAPRGRVGRDSPVGA